MTCQERKLINYIFTKMPLKAIRKGKMERKKKLINFSKIASRCKFFITIDFTTIQKHSWIDSYGYGARVLSTCPRDSNKIKRQGHVEIYSPRGKSSSRCIH